MPDIIINGKLFEGVEKLAFDTEDGEKAYYITERESTLITFTINEVEYQAENGMTFSEWLDSDYNTDNATVISSSNGYMTKWGLWLQDDSSNFVEDCDIIESKAYTLTNISPNQ